MGCGTSVNAGAGGSSSAAKGLASVVPLNETSSSEQQNGLSRIHVTSSQDASTLSSNKTMSSGSTSPGAGMLNDGHNFQNDSNNNSIVNNSMNLTDGTAHHNAKINATNGGNPGFSNGFTHDVSSGFNGANNRFNSYNGNNSMSMTNGGYGTSANSNGNGNGNGTGNGQLGWSGINNEIGKVSGFKNALSHHRSFDAEGSTRDGTGKGVDMNTGNASTNNNSNSSINDDTNNNITNNNHNNHNNHSYNPNNSNNNNNNNNNNAQLNANAFMNHHIMNGYNSNINSSNNNRNNNGSNMGGSTGAFNNGNINNGNNSNSNNSGSYSTHHLTNDNGSAYVNNGFNNPNLTLANYNNNSGYHNGYNHAPGFSNDKPSMNAPVAAGANNSLDNPAYDARNHASVNGTNHATATGTNPSANISVTNTASNSNNINYAHTNNMSEGRNTHGDSMAIVRLPSPPSRVEPPSPPSDLKTEHAANDKGAFDGNYWSNGGHSHGYGGSQDSLTDQQKSRHPPSQFSGKIRGKMNYSVSGVKSAAAAASSSRSSSPTPEKAKSRKYKRKKSFGHIDINTVTNMPVENFDFNLLKGVYMHWELLVDLSMYPSDEPVPLKSLEIIWQNRTQPLSSFASDTSQACMLPLQQANIIPALKDMESRKLIYTSHNFQLVYIPQLTRARVVETMNSDNYLHAWVEKRHAALLAAYQETMKKDPTHAHIGSAVSAFGWASITDDGYIHNNLIRHHIACNNITELIDEVLCDMRWICYRAEYGTMDALLFDYDMIITWLGVVGVPNTSSPSSTPGTTPPLSKMFGNGNEFSIAAMQPSSSPSSPVSLSAVTLASPSSRSKLELITNQFLQYQRRMRQRHGSKSGNYINPYTETGRGGNGVGNERQPRLVPTLHGGTDDSTHNSHRMLSQSDNQRYIVSLSFIRAAIETARDEMAAAGTTSSTASGKNETSRSKQPNESGAHYSSTAGAENSPVSPFQEATALARILNRELVRHSTHHREVSNLLESGRAYSRSRGVVSQHHRPMEEGERIKACFLSLGDRVKEYFMDLCVFEPGVFLPLSVLRTFYHNHMPFRVRSFALLDNVDYTQSAVPPSNRDEKTGFNTHVSANTTGISSASSSSSSSSSSSPSSSSPSSSSNHGFYYMDSVPSYLTKKLKSGNNSLAKASTNSSKYGSRGNSASGIYRSAFRKPIPRGDIIDELSDYNLYDHRTVTSGYHTGNMMDCSLDRAGFDVVIDTFIMNRILVVKSGDSHSQAANAASRNDKIDTDKEKDTKNRNNNSDSSDSSVNKLDSITTTSSTNSHNYKNSNGKIIYPLIQSRKRFMVPQPVHAFILDVCSQQGMYTRCHRAFLHAYQASLPSPSAWYMVPDDGYIMENLLHHFFKAKEWSAPSFPLLFRRRWTNRRLTHILGLHEQAKQRQKGVSASSSGAAAPKPRSGGKFTIRGRSAPEKKEKKDDQPSTGPSSSSSSSSSSREHARTPVTTAAVVKKFDAFKQEFIKYGIVSGSEDATIIGGALGIYKEEILELGVDAAIDLLMQHLSSFQHDHDGIAALLNPRL